jgi:hypothetical protein
MGNMKAFLSHNREDKTTSRSLGAQLKLVGADIWFDEWEIRAGDSIPGKVNEALAAVDTVILVWSVNANRSNWVGAELDAAIARAIEEGVPRIVPLRLDGTPLPPLIRPLKDVDLSSGDLARAVDEIMGFANDKARLLAIQATLDEASIEVRYFDGYGPVVCCPGCGAGVDRLLGYSEIDQERDDTYAGFRCQDCGFADGGEI